MHSHIIPSLLQKHQLLGLNVADKCFGEVHGSNLSPIAAYLNPLNAELNPICHLLALLGAYHIFHVGGLRVN